MEYIRVTSYIERSKLSLDRKEFVEAYGNKYFHVNDKDKYKKLTKQIKNS